MAFTDVLRVTVGSSTKKTDADNIALNTEWLEQTADVEHDFAISAGTGRHNNYLYGTGVTGAVANITDADVNATTIAQTGTISLTSGRILRATGAVTLSQAITVNKQNGQARGSYPTTHGSPGISLGAILAAVGGKGMPVPIRPGGDGTSLCGGVLQILAVGNVAVGGAITAQGTNASSEGGGGGGLVVIVSAGTISGSSAIDVSAGAGHATAAARGGAGSYSGEPGGHAGIGGSGGALAAAAGAGVVTGTTGGNNNGGGGCLDNAGGNGDQIDGNFGGNGTSALISLNKKIGYVGSLTAATAGGNGTATGGAAGSNGGGGGGGGRGAGAGAGDGGNGGDAGSGGGGGGPNVSGSFTGGAGGNGAAGSTRFLVSSSLSVYAGKSGGQGGGGGGGGGQGITGGAAGTGGAGAAGSSADGYGDGAGGAGASGGNGTAGVSGSNGSATAAGGAGGAGGNGGGAAGLVILIAPTVTYSGTVTGRLVTISGTDAYKFLRGIYEA